ncbi:MAG: DUF4129 domain-containing protein [Ilumatobacter sp.]|uniref:DUF4129 domain-containing protein n=1 Tax=Ilumatobacter sp. TaxID=1967498 RepID=UPI003919DB07
MSVDPDEAREVACDATASPELCDVREITEPVDPIVINPPAGGAGIGLLGTILVVMLVLAIVAALAWLVKAWLADRESDDDDDDDDLDDDLGERDRAVGERIIDHETPPARWRRLAGEHRSAGRYRDSIRCEYRALVGDLARRGHVDEIPGRTSGEERAQIAALSPVVAIDFDVAADLFDQAWFDDAPVTEDHDRRFVASSAAVLGAVAA